MFSYKTTISWGRDGSAFTDNRYSRSHRWEFDGGVTIHASASSHIVPEPLSDPGAVDPEEAFVASISSCHMLWFLSIAARKGFIVDRYTDTAEGTLDRNDNGRLAMTHVQLNPAVVYSGDQLPTPEQDSGMHHQAHEQCFIASSVKTEISVRNKFFRAE
jgi:organic hydroperoxide reductase OsmC/OhrA